MNQEQNNLSTDTSNIQSNNDISNNQSFNQNKRVNKKILKNKIPKKINLGFLIGIVGMVFIGIGGFLQFTRNNKQVSDNQNSKQEYEQNTSNKENNSNNDTISNEIIKIVSNDNNENYLLDTQGKIYTGNSKTSEKYIELELDVKNKVVDIAITDSGLIFKLDNGEFYLISHRLKTDKEIKTSSYSSAKRIMLDNITQYAIEEVSCNNYLFLTKEGDLYNLDFSSNNQNESNVKKIMSNVKKIEAGLRNTAIIDNDNNGYVCGYNVTENGILGSSGNTFNNEVCTPVKIGENIKEIDVNGWNLMHSLNIYYINTNNELYVIGQSANNNYFMGVQNNFIDKPVKLYDNVKNVHAMALGCIIETLDGKLIKLDTNIMLQEMEITNDYNKVIIPKGYRGIFILNNQNVLYGYGSNDCGKFGLKKEEASHFDEVKKLKDNVKKVFISEDFNGSTSCYKRW